jgi:hypothetical protein
MESNLVEPDNEFLAWVHNQELNAQEHDREAVENFWEKYREENEEKKS